MALLNKGDYLTACEVLKTALGRASFHQALRDEFVTPEFEHASIHETIFSLDSRIVATPNFDKIYETYANTEAHGSIVVKHHYDPDIAQVIRGTERCLLKVHGSIDSPDRMVFTRKEYAEARSRYREFYSLLEALALTHTFLFIGCGVDDPDIRLLLEDVYFRHPSARPHFFVLPVRRLHSAVRTVLEESMNLTMLTYNPKDDHAELGEALIQLADAVESGRDQLRTTGNW
jgi:hypothetical protein